MGFNHQPIARDFREDGRRGHGHAQAVTFDNHSLFDGDIWEPNGIEDEKIGRGTELEEGLFHRPACSLPDINRIDDLGVYDSHSEAEGHVPDEFIKSLALPLIQSLRVTKPDKSATATRKNDSGRDNGARQRPASDFVQAGDAPKSPSPCLTLEDFVGRQWHGDEVYAPAGTLSAEAATGAESCLVLPSARYSRSATRAIFPFFVLK